MVGYSWGQMMMFAIPPDGFWGINLRYLNLLIPLAAALGKNYVTSKSLKSMLKSWLVEWLFVSKTVQML